MSDVLSVSTAIRCYFRILSLPTEPPLSMHVIEKGSSRLREELEGQGRVSDTLVAFLLELDRKLDIVVNHLQRDRLEENFPYEGRIVLASEKKVILECREPLAPGDFCELVFFLNEYPLNTASAIGQVEGLTGEGALCHPSYTQFVIRLDRMHEDDREALIKFIFQEERKRIRQQKSMD